ncbi:MAG: DUF2652 domain-containing protein [Geminicoccaceae bacterium]
MLPTSESACFVIADISGYTGFMAGVELDHAQDIVADLMDTVLRCLRPRFRLAKFEGDAVFVYAVGERHDGSAVQDAIEGAYLAFRRRLRSIGLSTTCTCAACRAMHKLDLKVVAHHGAFVRQRMGGREELAGRDVILVHRLLKNSAGERLGGHAYALYTDACLAALSTDPHGRGLLEHREDIDIIGDVACRLRDLEAAWAEDQERQRHEVPADRTYATLTFTFAAPRPQVWEHFTRPDLRPKWRAADEVIEATAGGRRGVGTTNHCMHGHHAIVEEILDWRPYDYLTLTTLVPRPAAPKVLMTYAFADSEGGTRVDIRIARPKPKDKPFLDEVGAIFAKNITGEVEVLRGLLEASAAVPPAIAEPDPPRPRQAS